MNRILELTHVTKAFGGVLAVNDLTFWALDGEILGLVGPNGSGKTTVFNLITGFQSLWRGAIGLRGQDITNWPSHRITSQGIARTFQGTRLLGGLSVFDNLHVACHCRTRGGLWAALARPGAASREERETIGKVADLLEFLGLRDHARASCDSLPCLHRSLVGIGMALATEPTVLLLDEPMAGLNPTETRELMALIRRIRDRNVTVIVVEHKMAAMMEICDRMVVLDSGLKIAEGAPREISQNPEVIKAYLGDFRVDAIQR